MLFTEWGKVMQSDKILALVSLACKDDPPDGWNANTEITLDTTFEELGVDSIKALEIAAYLEERLGLQFPDDELSAILDMRGFVALVQRQTIADGVLP
jgi:acyl carrier protein